MNQLQKIRTKRVAIFLQEASRIVKHNTSEMIQTKRSVYIRFWFQIISVSSMSLVNLCEHSLIGSFWEFGFLVYKSHNVELLDGNEIESVLIVNEFNVLPVNALVIIFFLLELEYMTNEELLEILIGVVYTELFETIVSKILETEDIENAYRGARYVFRSVDRFVDFFNNVNE